MFDTHCHLTFPQFRGRTSALLDAAADAGVRGAITISTTTRDCLDALALARSDPRLWCTAGIHPLHSDEPIEWANLRTVAEDPRCVAWGELGLDNHYDHPPRQTQRRVLEEQLARIEGWRREGLDLPIVVHCREAFDDLIPVLRETPFPRDRFVFHCFTAGTAEIRAVLDFGAHVSFTGVVTFANARDVSAAARLVPADRIMVETDAPFLSPEPVRSMRTNEPANVAHIHRFLARLRGESEGAFDAQVDRTVESFFGITLPPPAEASGTA
ncbi:MAG TPA: TatD family hydrolase [Phycisphaerales bacterium]|nr:TatD family hydrolase [Phycisphaerales bacterium]HMP38174.1 TatD family hydrolase [Phycisphaerales bacterium]